MWEKETRDEVLRRRAQSEAGGGAARIAKQHGGGKLTARERLERLFDEGSFVEVGDMRTSRITDFGMEKKRLPGDGVVTGYGKVGGRTVFAASQDFTVIGGTLGEAHANKICQVMDMALETGAPFVSLNDSGGARIEEGITSLNGYGDIFRRNTRASGVIPQISVILGPCAGGACYSPAICDFIFMVEKKSYMFITGPQVVKSVTREDVTSEELGGTDVHTRQSGVCHFAYPDEESCLRAVRDLLCILPQNSRELPPLQADTILQDGCAELEELVPQNSRKAYDMLAVVSRIVDRGSMLEVQKDFARNIITCFAAIDHRTVGIVANQPGFMGGSLDCDASDKAARFVRFCDCYNIPIVTLVDVPAFLPGRAQESAGIIRHGAKLLYAFAECTVPTVTVILRKAFGGAYIAMNSKSLGADQVFAWPIAQIAVMGADGAANIIFRHQIEAAADPEAERQKMIDTYEKAMMTPYIAAERGYVDRVILPEETRASISSALAACESKRRTDPKDRHHGNIPL